MYTTKNYMNKGGDNLVIGGKLEILSGASVTGITTATIVDNLTSDDATKALSGKQGKALKTLVDAMATTASIVNNLTTGGIAVPLSAEQGKVLGARVAVAQAASTATEVAAVVVDLNALIAKLKTAGLMLNE